MPQEVQEWLPRADILSFEETLRIKNIGAELGVTGLRMAGGEHTDTALRYLILCARFQP